MCRNKHYFPAVPPADYNGTLERWIKQLRKMGFVKGRLPKGKLPLRKVWLEEVEYLEVLKECEV